MRAGYWGVWWVFAGVEELELVVYSGVLNRCGYAKTPMICVVHTLTWQ